MGTVLSTVDATRGPIPIFSDLDDAMAKKIAVKSMISTMSFSQETDSKEQLEGEAIIPFPDEKLVCFIFYRSLDQRDKNGEPRVISLATVTSTKEVSKMYKSAPKISSEAKKLAKIINQNYNYPDKLSDEIKQQIIEWGKLSKTETAKAPETEKKEPEYIAPEEFGIPELFELFEAKRKDPIVDIIVAFFWNIPVVIVGEDPEFLIEIANNLNILFEPKDLRIELVTGKEIPRADIVVLTKEQYDKATFTPDPMLVLTTSNKLLSMNIDIDNQSRNIVDDWVSKTRRRAKKDVDFALRTAHDEARRLIQKLEMLTAMAKSQREIRRSDIIRKLRTNRTELDFLIYIVLNFPNYCPLDLLTNLLKPPKPYEAFTITDNSKIGDIK